MGNETVGMECIRSQYTVPIQQIAVQLNQARMLDLPAELGIFGIFEFFQ